MSISKRKCNKQILFFDFLLCQQSTREGIKNVYLFTSMTDIHICRHIFMYEKIYNYIFELTLHISN